MSINTILQIQTGNSDATVVVNDVINGIFPRLLPLVAIIFCWWLMARKKMSALKVMGILVGVSIVGVALGLF